MENNSCNICEKSINQNEKCCSSKTIQEMKYDSMVVKCEIYRQMACENLDKIIAIGDILNTMFDINITNNLINIENTADKNKFISELKKALENKIDLCVEITKMLECSEIL